VILLRNASQNNEAMVIPELLARKQPTRNKAVGEQGKKEDDDQSQHLIEQAIDYRPFGLNQG
jgi:hypothetical protein